MFLRFFSVTLFLCFTLMGNAYAAGDDSNNNCEKLSILITNSTGKECRLINNNLNHGFFTYTSQAPAFIPSKSTSYPFVITQSLLGADIDLTYQCGDSSQITIHSQQNLCFFYAGNINASVSNVSNMGAWAVPTVGSYFWNQHGSIHWSFE